MGRPKVTASTGVPAVLAFVASLGVNTHLGFIETYADPAAVMGHLRYLGIENVRDFAPPAGTPKAASWYILASNGVRFTFNLDQSANIGEFLGRLRGFTNRYPGQVTNIEGPNEIWNWPIRYQGMTGMQAGTAVQRALFKAIKADHDLSSIPVLTLTTGGGSPDETFRKLGDLSDSANFGNVHTYPQGSDPAPYKTLIADASWQTSVIAPHLPTVITEAGYYTLPDDRYGVNEHVQSVYTLDLVLDAYLQGVRNTFLYELIDDHPDPTASNPESHFGLFRANGTPKPVATALHNLNMVIGDGRKPADTDAMHYKVGGLPERGYVLPLVKAHGRQQLVLWAEPIIWDKTTASQKPPPTSTVRVEFGKPCRGVSIYDPMLGSNAIAKFDKADSVDLTITDHPVIIEWKG